MSQIFRTVKITAILDAPGLEVELMEEPDKRISFRLRDGSGANDYVLSREDVETLANCFRMALQEK